MRDCAIYVAQTKALISFAVTVKLICVFVFVYVKCRFSHDAAHLFFANRESRPSHDIAHIYIYMLFFKYVQICIILCILLHIQHLIHVIA